MQLKLLVIVRNTETGEWVAGFNEDKSLIMSPKMCDSYIFDGGIGTSKFVGKYWKLEKIWVRAFVPPKPRRWKPKKKPKTRRLAVPHVEVPVG